MSAVGPQTLRNYWAVERRELKNRGFALGPLDHAIGGRLVGTAVTMADVSVLIPVGVDDLFAESNDLMVSIRRSNFDMGDGGSEYLQISCRDETLEIVFAQLCADLIVAVTDSDRPGAESRALYDRWRALFAGRPVGGLGKSELVGLFGELHALHELISSSTSRDISIWTGPDRAVHDFQNGPNHIEVKSTTNRNELLVEVHGLGQLDVPELENLHLMVHRVSISDNGFTIDDEVERIVALGVDRIALYAKLTEAGYDWADSKEYARFRFRVEETRCFRVDDRFPRIINTSFVGGRPHVGVVRVQYSLDLTSHSDGELSSVELIELFRLFEKVSS
jgi:hypothetical protein